jgi:hypothetical protein
MTNENKKIHIFRRTLFFLDANSSRVSSNLSYFLTFTIPKQANRFGFATVERVTLSLYSAEFVRSQQYARSTK